MMLAAALATVILTTPTEPIKVTTIDGKSMVLADKPATVIVFVTTTCPIAREMQPTLANLHKEFSPQGVQFLAAQIDITLEPAEVKSYVNDFKIPLPQTIDEGHRLVKAFKARITPEAVVLNKAGQVVYQGRIDNTYPEIGIRKKPTSHELKDAITATLANKKPIVTKTNPIGCLIPDLEDF